MNNQTIEEEAGLPPNWKAVDVPAINPGAPPSDNLNTRGSYYSAPISPTMQHDAVLVATKYSGRTPQNALMPIPSSGQPTVNATVRSGIVISAAAAPSTDVDAVIGGVHLLTGSYTATAGDYSKLLSFGAAGSGYLAADGTVGATGTTNAISPGTATPTTSNDVLLWITGNPSHPITAPAGYTLIYGQPSPDALQGPWSYKEISGVTTPSAVQRSGHTDQWGSIAQLFTYSGSLSASGTSTSVTSNILTVTAVNNYIVGQVVSFANFVFAAYLNLGPGNPTASFPILTVSSTQFTVDITSLAHSDYATTADSGTVNSMGVLQQSTISGGAAGTTATVTFANPVKKGNLIFFAATDIVNSGPITATITSVMDNLGNSYPVTNRELPSGPSAIPVGAMAATAYLFAPTSGITTLTYTVSYSGSNGDQFGATAYELISGSAGGGSATLTLPLNPPSAFWYIAVENTSSSNLTIFPNGKLLDGASSNLIVPPGQGVFIFTDGFNYFTERGLFSGLPASGVTPGSYTNTNLTVNAQGIITAASNGSGGGGGGGSLSAITWQQNLWTSANGVNTTTQDFGGVTSISAPGGGSGANAAGATNPPNIGFSTSGGSIGSASSNGIMAYGYNMQAAILMNLNRTTNNGGAVNRFWIGISDDASNPPTTMGGSDAPAGQFVAFRFSNGTGGPGDTHWKCITNNNDGSGASPTVVDSGVTPDTNFHLFSIVATDSVPNVKFYIDGVLVATITTTLPATGKVMRWLMVVNESDTTSNGGIEFSQAYMTSAQF